MRILTQQQVMSKGRLILIYGDTGKGKTTSILQSAPLPIKYVQTERRSLEPQIESADRCDLIVGETLVVVQYDDWNDLIDYVNHFENFVEDTTIVIDSLSFLMNIDLSNEIQDQAFEARTESDKKKYVKDLVAKTKMSQEGYGGLAAQMFRLTAALQRLSVEGKVVICTALTTENPKWDRSLTAAPAFTGRLYPDNFPGFFDLIGLVEARTVVKRDKEGRSYSEIIYPPMVRFESDGSFVAKWTGKSDKRRGPLDFTKILSFGKEVEAGGEENESTADD